MTKDEAYEKNRLEVEPLLCPMNPQDPHSAPVVLLAEELQRIAEDLRGSNYVPNRLADAEMLVRAIVAPTMVVWSEPGEGTKRDPVSGSLIRATRLKSDGGIGGQALFDVKNNLVQAVRALAARAKSIGSGAYGELRDVHLELTKWSLHSGMLHPMDEERARVLVARFDEALFELYADNEIEKEVRHG